jgi:hypothetical protein
MFSLTRVTCAQHYTVTLHSYNNHFHIYFWQYLLLQFVHIIGEWATPRLSDQRWAKGGLIIYKRQDAYALVTISSNTLGQRAARSSCNDYVHIKRNFHWRSAPWFMVSYFYSSINYTAYHTGNTVPYQRAFLRSSASTVSGGKSLCVPRLTRFDRPRKMRDFEIFICQTSSRTAHQWCNTLTLLSLFLRYLAIATLMLPPECHSSFCLLFSLLPVQALMPQVSRWAQTGTNSFTVVALAWCIIITPREESFL